MAWQVYMVQTSCGKLYTGISTDPDRRYLEHLEMYNNKRGKGAKFFRGHQPQSLVYKELCEGRSDASQRECKIKKMSVRLKRELIATTD